METSSPGPLLQAEQARAEGSRAGPQRTAAPEWNRSVCITLLTLRTEPGLGTLPAGYLLDRRGTESGLQNPQ